MNRRLATGLVLAGLLAAADLAAAHSFDPALLTLRERGGAQPAGVFDVVWRLPAAGAGWSESDRNGIAPHFPAGCTVNDSRLVLDCGAAGLEGARLGVSGLGGTEIDVVVRISWRDGRQLSGVLHAGAPELTVPGRRTFEATSTRDLADRFARFGIETVLYGYAAPMFLALLVLWVGPQVRPLAKAAIAFSVGHSLTLTASILGRVALPSGLVESLVGLGLAVLAAEVAREDLWCRRAVAFPDGDGRPARGGASRPAALVDRDADSFPDKMAQRRESPDIGADVALRRPWVLAFVFGLLHGWSFAAALSRIGVPTEQAAWALGSFNAGIEVAQLACLFVFLLTARLLSRRRRSWALTRLTSAYAAGAVAMAWTFQCIAAG